jgi:hypothetical protein
MQKKFFTAAIEGSRKKADLKKPAFSFSPMGQPVLTLPAFPLSREVFAG